MPTLLDMLTYQTNLHMQLLKSEGLTNTTRTCRECIINIQTVIQLKRVLDINSTNTSSGVSFTQDATRVDPLAS